MSDYVIYAIRDTVTRERRYVGQTEDLHTRMQAHLCTARRGSMSPVSVWIRSCTDGVEVEIIDEVGIEELNEREAFWYRRLRLQGSDLLNNPKNIGSYARAA
jgi:hypothetical protein